MLIVQLTAPYSTPVKVENLVNWEDGSVENPRTIQMTGASDIILVAHVSPTVLSIIMNLINSILQISISLFTLMMVLTSLTLMMRRLYS